MVKAILEGRKTVTRRVVTRYNSSFGGTIGGWPALDFSQSRVDGIGSNLQYLHVPNPEWETTHRVFPKYDPGDVLWVRETWNRVTVINSSTFESRSEYRYKADFKGTLIKGHDRFKPSIHMPKEACRIRLEIQSIRVERLHDITEEDAIREGIEELLQSRAQRAINGRAFRDYSKSPEMFNDPLPPKESFRTLWESINGTESWKANPWTWRIEFSKI
jgi:hypothetical protein